MGFSLQCSHVAILHLISSWTRGGGEGEGEGGEKGEGRGEGEEGEGEGADRNKLSHVYRTGKYTHANSALVFNSTSVSP
jgi:hypothetical protein